MRHFLVVVASSTFLCAPFSAAPQTAAKTIECRPGEYAIGLTGRTGSWIDAVGPVCARWNERTFQPSSGRAVRASGGSGGRAQQRACPVGSAIGGWKVESISKGELHFADAISIDCQTLAPPNDVTSTGLRFGGDGQLPWSKRPPHERSCPAGKLVTAIHVRTSPDGRSVTDVEMRCGDAPYIPSAMTWQKQSNGTVKYNSPALRMRTGGDLQLDWCRERAKNCGAPAADAFCAEQGASKAISFTPKPKVGLTVMISDRKICNAPTCQGFASIVCGPA